MINDDYNMADRIISYCIQTLESFLNMFRAVLCTYYHKLLKLMKKIRIKL